MNKEKQQLLALFDHALSSVSGEKCVEEYLNSTRYVPDYIVAVGKAAADMMSGALRSVKCKQALLITSQDYLGERSMPPEVEVVLSTHPIPDDRSLRAGDKLVTFLSSLPVDCNLLFLISGGSSAMVEVLEKGIDLNRLRRLNQWALAHQLDIAGINDLRKRLSTIKGGGLLNYIKAKQVQALYVSDVKTDDPAVIGSGLLRPMESTKPWQDYSLPDDLQLVFSHLPEKKVVEIHRLSHHIIASAKKARQAIAKMGNNIFIHDHYLDSDVESVSKQLTGYLRNAPFGVHVWSGEPLVQLPANAGRGGRMGALALLIAREISSDNMKLSVLCGASDGQDGNSGLSGGIVDQNTQREGESVGMSLVSYIKGANSMEYLIKVGCAIAPRVTGTNVTDLIIALKSS